MLRSSTFLINGQESILAITIDEKTLTPDELKDTHQQDDTALDHNGLFITDYEVFTFRIWIWMQFHDDSSRKAKRYRDGIKDLLRKTSKLGFIVENDKDSIYKVARLRTSLMELFYSKSGAVHIIGNDLEVTVIN